MVRRHDGIEVDHGQELGLGLNFSTHVDPILPTPFLFKLFWSFSTAC
jgi:hypothetical protein